MTTASPADYKQRQAEFYAANAAGWERWAETVAPQAEGFNTPLLDAAGVQPGDRVLDLASGAGEPALTAAKRVGPRGHVTATDLSPEMLAIIGRRARTAGLANVSCRVADMEHLPFEAASFDRVICRFGIMYSPDATATCAAARRVLRPRGRAAFMVWGQPAENTLLWTVLSAANRLLDYFKGDEAEHPFCYAAPDSLAPHLRAGGLLEVEERELRFAPKIRVGISFWTPILGMNFGGALDKLDDAGRKAIDHAVEAALTPFLRDGAYYLNVHVRIALGTAP